MLKLIYKWILVIIVAFFLAFPLGILPLKFLENMTTGDAGFSQVLAENVFVIYLFFVVLSFVGLLLAFLVSLLIKSVATGEKLVEE